MLTPNERAEEFSQLATECENRAQQESDEAQKNILRELAAYYLRLADDVRPVPYN
jgi:hypothetical protein